MLSHSLSQTDWVYDEQEEWDNNCKWVYLKGVAKKEGECQHNIVIITSKKSLLSVVNFYAEVGKVESFFFAFPEF